MITYEVFRAFYSQEEAANMSELLTRNGIDVRVERRVPIADKTIAGSDGGQDILLKIKNSDFIRAHQIIDEYIQSNLASIDNDYYLYEFADEELFDIIKKPDEWNNQDAIIAKKILVERGYNITESDIQKISHQRLIDLEKPEKVGISWIITGYIAALFAIFGLIFGLVLMTSKKVLPNGRKAFVYDFRTRQHGVIITMISCIVILIVAIGIFTRKINYGA